MLIESHKALMRGCNQVLVCYNKKVRPLQVLEKKGIASVPKNGV